MADNEIIKSPQAERMLGMVTKGFYDRAYIAQWMFEVIGREYDEMAEWARGLRAEIFPQTCTWSIPIWEWVYGFEPDDTLSLDHRRQRILAKIIGTAPINPEVIRRGVASLTGAQVEIIENVAPYVFNIIIYLSGEPVNFVEALRYVRRIKPSHLAFTFKAIAGIRSDRYRGNALSMSPRFRLGSPTPKSLNPFSKRHRASVPAVAVRFKF